MEKKRGLKDIQGLPKARRALTTKDRLWSMIEDTDLKVDTESIMHSFATHLEFSQAKTRYTATMHDCFKALAYVIRDHLTENWNKTQQNYYDKDAKRIYYLSLEFLLGRALSNNLINLGIWDNVYEAMKELGYDLFELEEFEPDAGLGNGGLGRLAACFLDSMATLKLPGSGYGLMYDFGIFDQEISNGYQIERPDNWLQEGYPWSIVRPEYRFPVQFFGKTETYVDTDGVTRRKWDYTQKVHALANDIPVPGYKNKIVNNLRLWSAKAVEGFDLQEFNQGDYIKAVEQQICTENISRVLYPRDDSESGKELRLKQEYFFVSASIQDIIRRFKVKHEKMEKFSDKVAIHLNDTHPALAIPELMRILLDEEKMEWDHAWSISHQVFAYTNHTVLPEAMEKWPVDFLGHMLPRHMEIIFEINFRFLEEIKKRFPGDDRRLKTMSIIEEGPVKMARMANLAVVGSHSVNGVAKLHTEILKNKLFADFFEAFPEKFSNKTNGITQRRWLEVCNPRLSDLITENIGHGWLTELNQLKKLVPLADDETFRMKWLMVKKKNKKALADYIKTTLDIDVDPNSFFDCQVKRIHEYKRQLLNILHIITLYNRVKADPHYEVTSRTFIFAGKAAPGYWAAKMIIKLINSVANIVNADPDMHEKIKVVFIPNYSVTLAEKIIPAADISEQISTAGMEASGTGNMKLALNGALTIGTLDGATIEILEEVGADNMFIFGMKAHEVEKLKHEGYKPWDWVNAHPELSRAMNLVTSGFFSPENPGLFHALMDTLTYGGDHFMVLADYADYVKCQERVAELYRNQYEWTKKSILNTANSGKFSSDYVVRQYADEIWKARPVSF
jgi:starch phosphorylase